MMPKATTIIGTAAATIAGAGFVATVATRSPTPTPTPRLVVTEAWARAHEECARLAESEPLVCKAGCAAFADVCPKEAK